MLTNYEPESKINLLNDSLFKGIIYETLLSPRLRILKIWILDF